MALSGIANIGDVQLITIAGLRRRLQIGGNLRQFSTNYNRNKSVYGPRQAVRIPHNLVVAAGNLVDPDTGLKRNAANLGDVDIEWETGANARETSYPLAYSYDEWEAENNGLVPALIADWAAKQVTAYELFWDKIAINKLKAADRWAHADNHLDVNVKADLSSGNVRSLVQAALGITEVYWGRGMQRADSVGADGSPTRRIINIVNSKVVTAIMQEYFDSVAIGRALNDGPYLQASLGPLLGGTTIVMSHAMDNTITSAGDEYAFGSFLLGSLADVDDDSPTINARAYTATGDPTMERRIGFYRDLGIKHLDPLECFAIKMAVT